MKSLFERLRTRRLASVFILLGTLSAGIVAASYLAHGVRGQEKQHDSVDASPLKVVNSPVQPNEYVKIAKDVGPAVVNINTQTLPKQSANQAGRRDAFHGRPARIPRTRREMMTIRITAAEGAAAEIRAIRDFRISLIGSSGQAPDQGEDDGGGGRCASRSVPVSSSIRRVTSLPTITWSTKPTRFT